MSDTAPEAPAPKKGKMKKMLAMAGALVVLVGGGVAAGVYAAGAGLVGGGHGASAEKPGPKLVPKSEQKRSGGEGGGEHGGESGGSEGEGGSEGHGGDEGGDKFASNYYQLDKDFTANLQDSVHVIQVGLAISTPYDDKVVQNLQTNEIAVRSAVLMALGDTPEEDVFASAGKKKLAARLVAAINDTLKQKEGFGGVGNVYFTSFVVQ